MTAKSRTLFMLSLGTIVLIGDEHFYKNVLNASGGSRTLASPGDEGEYRPAFSESQNKA